MEIANFIEYNYESKSNIINKSQIDESKFKELIKKKILKKSNNGDYYCFEYVGAIFTPKSIIYVSPKVLTKENINKDFNENLIRLFISYSKREKLSVEEKEFIGTEINEGKGSLLSIIDFIMEDYLDSGLYTQNIKIKEINGSGRIDWNKTIDRNEIFINNKNQPIYYELVTIKKNIYSDFLITKIHKKIINTCNEILKKLYLIDVLKYDIEDFDIDDCELEDNEFLLEKLQNELDSQYEDKKIALLEILIAFLKKYQQDGNDVELTLFGTRNFEIVWEKMNSYIFRNQYDDLSSKIPKPKWYRNGSNEAEKRKTLIPDILYLDEDNKKYYIIDAKYYTTDFKDNKLIGTVQGIEDIVKQLVYEDVLSQKYLEYDFINTFIIPTINESKKIGMVKFPISNTGQTVQLVHMNIYDVIQLYLGNRRLNITKWATDFSLDSFIEAKEISVAEKITPYENKNIEYQTINENRSSYSESSNIKYSICNKLLSKKFDIDIREEELRKIKYLSEDKIDNIIDNIFEIKTIVDLRVLIK